MTFKEKVKQIGPDVAIALILGSGIGHVLDISHGEGYPPLAARTDTLTLEDAEQEQQEAQRHRDTAIAEQVATAARLRTLGVNACINYLTAEYKPPDALPDEEGLEILAKSGVCGDSVSEIRTYVDQLHSAASAVDRAKAKVALETTHVKLHKDAIREDKEFSGALAFVGLVLSGVAVVETGNSGTPFAEWRRKTRD